MRIVIVNIFSSSIYLKLCSISPTVPQRLVVAFKPLVALLFTGFPLSIGPCKYLNNCLGGIGVHRHIKAGPVATTGRTHMVSFSIYVLGKHT